MIFHVIETPRYIEGLEQFSLSEKIRIERFIIQIKENAPFVGQPLGYSFFREKKFNGNRLYFLVYVEWNAAAIVGFSDKKTQAQTIQLIKENLSQYKEFVYNELKRQNLI